MPKNNLYSIVIVDDENDAIEVVTKLLKDFTTFPFKIAGTANDLDKGFEIKSATKIPVSVRRSIDISFRIKQMLSK